MSYAGEFTAAETYQLLNDTDDGVLVDCRTTYEWSAIGLPDTQGLNVELMLVEWLRFEDGEINPRFVDELIEAGVDPAQPVYFICRSGVRSLDAAITATAAGFTQAYNVSDGFEGDPDEEGIRGRVNGWQSAGLPWRAGVRS